MKKDKFELFEQIGFPKAKEVIRTMERKAKKGDVEALFILGASYHQGCGVEVDVRKAVTYLEKAAKKDHIASLNLLASIYFEGDGNVQEDNEKFMSCMEKLASLGDSDAQMFLVDALHKVIEEGVLSDEDEDQAEETKIYLLHEMAKKGDIDAGITYALSKEERLAFAVDIVEDDIENYEIEDDVLEYLQRGALAEIPVASAFLGTIYEKGRVNLPKSNAIAMKCYKLAHLLEPTIFHEYTHFKKKYKERDLNKFEKNDFTDALEKLLSRLEK